MSGCISGKGRSLDSCPLLGTYAARHMVGFQGFLLGALVLLILLVSVVWISYRTGYTITEDSLEIRRGPFSEKDTIQQNYQCYTQQVFWPSGTLL